jgi:methylase of polypeptide subunit release factors
MSEILLVPMFPSGSVELECSTGVHAPGPSSMDLANLIPDCTGLSVLDLGCNSGIFGIFAAKRGAREVWAVDEKPEAAACTLRNAERNGVTLQVETGRLFEPVGDRKFDLMVTNPPQTPAPEGVVHPRLGGADGLDCFASIIDQAPRHLARRGRLLTMITSLADTVRFEELLSKRFAFAISDRAQRAFTRKELDDIVPGLFHTLSARRRRGLAEFTESGDRYFCWVRSYMARLK